MAAALTVFAPDASDIEAAPTNGVGRVETDDCSGSGTESTAVNGRKTKRGKKKPSQGRDTKIVLRQGMKMRSKRKTRMTMRFSNYCVTNVGNGLRELAEIGCLHARTVQQHA